jgi:hypothetical protein
LPTSLHNLGSPCLGPRLLCYSSIKEHCPNNSAIHFGTSTLFPQNVLGEDGNWLALHTRCDWCYWEHGRIRHLSRLGILAKDDQGPMCVVKDCPDLHWDRSSHCMKHIPLGIKGGKLRRKRRLQQKVRDILPNRGPSRSDADTVQLSGDAWQCSPKFQIIYTL